MQPASSPCSCWLCLKWLGADSSGARQGRAPPCWEGDPAECTLHQPSKAAGVTDGRRALHPSATQLRAGAAQVAAAGGSCRRHTGGRRAQSRGNQHTHIHQIKGADHVEVPADRDRAVNESERPPALCKHTVVLIQRTWHPRLTRDSVSVVYRCRVAAVTLVATRVPGGGAAGQSCSSTASQGQ